MTDSPTLVPPSRPSGIPIPINKRSSLSYNNTPNQSTSSSSNSRPSSPVILSAPPPGKNGPHGVRRQSLLNASGRRASAGESSSDDPGMHFALGVANETAQLKSQIAILQSSLATMHQRMVQMTADLPLGSSTSGSSRPLTPTHGFLDLPSTDGTTPLSALSQSSMPNGDDNGINDTAGGVENGRPEDKFGKSLIPRLPHSTSSYDLRSSAITPGKTPTVRKTSDGPLGLSREYCLREIRSHQVSLNRPSLKV